MYKFMNNPYLKPNYDLGGGIDDFEDDNDFDFDIDNNDDELEELSKEDEQPEVKQEEKPKTYTGEDIRRAVEAERNKWKRKSNTQNDVPQNDSGFNESDYYNKQVEYYIENDFDERLAKVLAKKDSEQKKKEIEIEKRLSSTGDYATKFKRDYEVQQMKSNPFYSDIDSVRGEVETFANKTNVTMEDAYFALYGRQKLPDWQRQVEATFLNEQAKKNSSRVNTVSGGNADKPKLDLSQEEIAAAKLFGMSPKEVKMMGKIDDVGKYEKYMKKKG